MNERYLRFSLIIPGILAVLLILQVLGIFWGRWLHPYDLEWMEGGVLAHAWRLQHGKQIYVEPNPDFIPMIYPPGYPGLVAILGLIPGISHGLGRTVSILGTLASCGAIVWIAQRRFQAPWAGLLGAAMFLGTYPRSGAFMDLVRPDALAMGLLAWAVALGLERDPRHHRNAGLLLFLAFVAKHNSAAFGFPLAIGIMARDGAKEGLRFGLWAALPALAFTAVMQLWTGGLFYEWMVTVPQSHPMVDARIMPGSVREMGNTMFPSLVVLAVWVLATGPLLVRRIPVPVMVVVPTLAGALAIQWMEGMPPVRGIMPPTWYEAYGAYAFVGLGMVSIPLVAIGRGLEARGGPMWVGTVGLAGFVWLVVGILGGWTWRVSLGLPVFVLFTTAAALSAGDRRGGLWFYGSGLIAAAWFTAGLMRGHHGGFINVFMTLHWATALGMAIAMAHMAKHTPRNLGYVLAAVAACVQLWPQYSHLQPDQFIPDEADVAAGDSLVEALEQVEGPVLSPFAPWLPAQAGHEPHWHLIALWDIRHQEGPFQDTVTSFVRAAAQKHWGAVLEAGDDSGIGIGLRRHYRKLTTFRHPGKALQPKTGWRRRPSVLWVRKVGDDIEEDEPVDSPSDTDP